MVVKSRGVQANRFELKHLIDSQRALAIRDFIRSHLVLDPFMTPDRPNGYAVKSAYLDTSNFSLCHATMNGIKNRFKLRLRYYDNAPDSPVFFEVKRRIDQSIFKSRAAIKRECVSDLFQGRPFSEQMLVTPDKVSDRAAIHNFLLLKTKLAAQPKVLNTYDREAYVSESDNSVRVTMDRNLNGGLWDGSLDCPKYNQWHAPTIKGVILELKFTHRFPLWMRDLSHRFQLQKISVPKYVECAQKLHCGQSTPIGQIGELANL